MTKDLTVRQGVARLCFAWGAVAFCCYMWRRHDVKKEGRESAQRF